MKAVIYARYSSDSQREESIEGQIRECTEYAKRNGITILGTVLSIVLRKFLLNRLDCLRPGRASAVKGACTRLALDGR